MIAQFPNFYPDELMYSLLARYYVRSGHFAFRYCAEELFKRPTHPDVEYCNDMTEEVKELLGITMVDVIYQHTMFPWNARFINRDRRQLGMESLKHGTSEYQNSLYRMRGQANTTRYLRFCPACAAEDRAKYGETYWHRIHQIQGLNICPKHHCFLFDSEIKIEGKGSPSNIHI